jgi:hypothetical protein
MTTETLRVLLKEYIGVEFPEDEVERLLPLYERQLERMRELQALDLGGDDPRTMAYINDRRPAR